MSDVCLYLICIKMCEYRFFKEKQKEYFWEEAYFEDKCKR